MGPNPIPKRASEQWRNAFVETFDKHDALTEREEDIHAVENAGDLPDSVALQRTVAAYEEAYVWLLNEGGPLQAFYSEEGEWGNTGGIDTVAEEMSERLG
jgi:hypothetical protein